MSLRSTVERNENGAVGSAPITFAGHERFLMSAATVGVGGKPVGVAQNQSGSLRTAVPPENDGSAVGTMGFADGNRLGEFPAEGPVSAPGFVRGHVRSTRFRPRNRSARERRMSPAAYPPR